MSTTKEKNPNEIILTKVRLSFPHLGTPKAIGDGKPRYTASFLLDPKDETHKGYIQWMRNRANQLFAEGTKKADAKPRADRTCIKKGNDEEGVALYDGYDGMWVASAARSEKQGAPFCIDRNKTELKDPDKTLYAGCYVNAKIRLYYSDYDGTKRITASLEVVQFVKDGEPFGQGKASADDMPDIEDSEEDGLADIDEDDDL